MGCGMQDRPVSCERCSTLLLVVYFQSGAWLICRTICQDLSYRSGDLTLVRRCIARIGN